jgi:PEP-CTERM motif
VHIRLGIVRRIVIVVAVLLVSGAAAAMKLTSWTPANMCFCPTPDRSDSAVASESAVGVLSTSGGLSLPSTGDTTAHNKGGAIGSAPLVALSEKSNWRKAEGGKQSWAPWGRNYNRRSTAAGESQSGPSVSLGGLWKMMSLAARGHQAETIVASARVASPRTARESKEPRSPSPKPSASPSGGISATPAQGSGSAFQEDATPVAELVNGSPSANATGSLGAGLGSSSAAAQAGSVSGTPEPGSLALLATGLLGIAGLIRRRRI